MNDIGSLIEIPKYVYLDLFGILLLSASAGFYLIKKTIKILFWINRITISITIFSINILY